MRKLILQSKTIKYTAVAFSSSNKIGNKNFLITDEYKISLPLDTAIRPGERLEVIGRVDDTVQSLYTDRFSLIAQSIKHSRRNQSFVLSSLFKLLNLLEEIPRVVEKRLSGFLEPSQASLLVGIVFGGVQNMPKSLLEDTKNTGLIHITSASGFNLTLLLLFSLSLFTRITNRRIAALISLVLMFAYSCMTGFSPPITRAALMSVLYVLALTMGKEYRARWSLLVSGVIILVYRPFLIFSPSFQLSYIATVGVLFSDVFKIAMPTLPGSQENVLHKTLDVLLETLSSTWSVLLWTTPIILKHFGIFSLVSLLSNTLLLWMVGPLMAGGIVAVFLLFLPKVFLTLFAVPLGVLLEVFIRSVHLFSSLPLSTIEVTEPSWMGVLIYYFCLGVYVLSRLAKGNRECLRNVQYKKTDE